MGTWVACQCARSLPTHTGVDLPDGTYRVTAVADGPNGPITTVEEVTRYFQVGATDPSPESPRVMAGGRGNVDRNHRSCRIAPTKRRAQSTVNIPSYTGTQCVLDGA